MKKCRNTDSILVVEGINFKPQRLQPLSNTFGLFDILPTFSDIAIKMERDY